MTGSPVRSWHRTPRGPLRTTTVLHGARTSPTYWSARPRGRRCRSSPHQLARHTSRTDVMPGSTVRGTASSRGSRGARSRSRPSHRAAAVRRTPVHRSRTWQAEGATDCRRTITPGPRSAGFSANTRTLSSTPPSAGSPSRSTNRTRSAAAAATQQVAAAAADRVLLVERDGEPADGGVDDNVRVLALKPADRGPGVIVRLQSVAPSACQVRLRWTGVRLTAAARCDGRERDLAPLDPLDDAVPLTVDPGITSVRLVC